MTRWSGLKRCWQCYLLWLLACLCRVRYLSVTWTKNPLHHWQWRPAGDVSLFCFHFFIFLCFFFLPSPLPFVILGGTCLPTCLPCVASRTAGRRESWELSDAVGCCLLLATHSFGPLFRLDGRPGWARPGQSAGHLLAVGSSGHWGAWWLLSSWGHPCPVPWWLPAYTPSLALGPPVVFSLGCGLPLLGSVVGGEVRE